MDEKKFHDIYCKEVIPKVIHNRELVASKKIKENIWSKFIKELLAL
jgi:hypothetical protein